VIAAGSDPAISDAAERRLFDAIAAADRLAPWERELKREIILTEGAAQRLEAKLDDRIDAFEERMRVKRALAPAARSGAWRVAAGLALAVLTGYGGYQYYTGAFTALPTYVLQAEGADAGAMAAGPLTGRQALASAGGAVKLVNTHGYMQLRNGASLTLDRVTPDAVRYELTLPGYAESGTGNGAAAFYITKKPGGRSFVLNTPHYRIEVTGTYFRMLPDLDGRITTEVLEGSVRANSPQFGTVTVLAGQSLGYSKSAGNYVIRDGGPVVERAEVAQMPDMSAIGDYRVLAVTSNVAFATVTIDGRMAGTTPISMLVAEGSHRVRIGRDNFTGIDTLVTVGANRPARLYAVLTEQDRTAPVAVSRQDAGRSAAAAVARQTEAETARKVEDLKATLRSADQDLLKTAQKAESSDWRAALTAYRSILDSETASAILKQAALFSIGRLLADNGQNGGEARVTFLRYLALYPDGAFARESLLRLAEIEFETDQDKAIEYYLKYFEKYPGHYRVSELQYRVGLIYLQKNRYDESVRLFEQSLANMLYDQPDMKQRIYSSMHKALVGKGDAENAAIIRERYLSKTE